MDALLTSVAPAARYGRPLPILLGIGLAALANSLLAAFGGVWVHDMVTLRALSLLLALALVFAGVAGLIRPSKDDPTPKSRFGPFLTSAGAFFVLEFGDKTQFLTFSIAAQFDALWMAAAGATAGIILSAAPAACLGQGLARAVPLRGIRIGLGMLFLAVGLIVGLSALRLL